MPRIDPVVSDVRTLIHTVTSVRVSRVHVPDTNEVHRIAVLVRVVPRVVLIHAPQAGRAITLVQWGQLD